MAGGCHCSGRRVLAYVLRVRPLRAGPHGSRDLQARFRSPPERRNFFGGYSLRERCIPYGKGVFPVGRVHSLRERRHSWRMKCVPMLPGETHVEKACPERPIPRGLRPACSPRPVGVSAGSRQRHPSRPALFRIRRFLFLSGKFPFPVGRDGCTLSGLEVLRLFAEESDHKYEHKYSNLLPVCGRFKLRYVCQCT